MENEITTLKVTHALEVNDLKSTIEKLKADYAKERQTLKDSGIAKQADYQRLMMAAIKAGEKVKDADEMVRYATRNERNHSRNTDRELDSGFER